MAKKIEIYENTLLKLLVRRGTDADRKNVTLSEGELGYTVDTKKLYIGDGQTLGGVPAGGVNFLGAYPLAYNQYPTTFLGDLIFAANNNTLHTYIGPDWREESSWKAIGGIYTKGNNTIIIDSSSNQIRVGTLSAGNISLNALGSSLTLDSLNKVSLANTISVDEIRAKNFGKVTLPNKFNYINGTDYSTDFNMPGNGPSGFLYSDTAGNLEWREASGGETLFVSGSAIVPVGTIMPFPSTTKIPNGWLACNGQSLLVADYPLLSEVLNNATGLYFTVPDLRNNVLYGSLTPQTATIYTVSSAADSATPITAKGILYIIKGLPDNVANVDMEVNYPIVATVNNIEMQNRESFSPLDGSVKLELDPSGSFGYRNKIINGNFDFWQRRNQTLNVSISNTPTYQSNSTRTIMTADRWYTFADGGSNARGVFSVTREPNTEANFPFLYQGEDETFQLNGNYFLRLKYDRGVGTNTDGVSLYNSLSYSAGILATQNIENASEVLGKPVTLSFWARAEQNTYIFAESQIHTGDRKMWTPVTTSNLFILTPEWQFFTYTYTMPTFRQVSAVAYNPETITATGGRYPERPAYTPLGSSGNLPPLSSWIYQVDIKTHWSRGALAQHGQSISATATGYNYYYPGSGTELDYPIGNFMTMPVLSTLCTNMLSGNPDGGYYDIAQVQLEVGKGATPFEHRPQQIELALCQRYFEKNYDVDTPPGTANAITYLHEYANYTGSNAPNTWAVSFPGTFKVVKRKAPTVQVYSPTSGTSGRCYRVPSTGSSGDVLGVIPSSTNTVGFHTGSVWPGGMGDHYLSWVAEAEI